MSLPLLAEQGYTVSWLELLEAAKKDGANLDTLIPRICDAIHDAYPRDFARVICDRLGILSVAKPIKRA